MFLDVLFVVLVDLTSFVTQLLEYDDSNDTADPTSDLFPPYRLDNFTWSRLNLSETSALLCGAADSFTNGSLCLQVSLSSW